MYISYFIIVFWETTSLLICAKAKQRVVRKYSFHPKHPVFKRESRRPEGLEGLGRAVVYYTCLCLPPHFGYLQNYKLLHVMLTWGIRFKQLCII